MISGGGFAVAALYGTLQLKADKWGKGLQDADRAIDRFAGKVERAGVRLTSAITVPLVALATDAMKTAMSFESAFTGVEKTVDGTVEQYATLRKELVDLSKVRTGRFEDLAKIAEVAGQMGVPIEDVLAFTDTVAQLQASTDIIGPEATQRLGQFINIMQSGTDEANLYGAAIAWLGNNLATTENTLLHLSQRLASYIAPIGFSPVDVMAISATARAVGIQPEEGGTSIGRIAEKMHDAVMGRKVKIGGSTKISADEALRRWGKISGMAADDWKRLFEVDPGEAFTRYFEGLTKLAEKGEDIKNLVDESGFGHTLRMRRAAVGLAQGSDDLRLAMEGARDAWNTTIDDPLSSPLWIEAEKRYDTYESKMEMFGNRVRAVKDQLGTALLPIVHDFLVSLQPVFDFIERTALAFANLDPKWQKFIFYAIAAVAALGPFLQITGFLIHAVSMLATGIGFLISPFGAVLALVGLVGFGLYQLYKNSEDFRGAIDGVWQAIQRGIDNAMPHFKNAIALFKEGEWLEGFKEIGNGLYAIWVEIWPAIKEAAQTVWDDVIWPWITETLPKLMKDAWEWVWPKVKAAAIKAWTTIKDAAEEVWDTHIYPWLTGTLPDKIEDAFSYLATKIPEWAALAFTSVLQGFKDAWHTEIQPWLHETMPNSIHDEIEKSPERLESAGSWIGRHVVNGLTVFWGGIVAPTAKWFAETFVDGLDIYWNDIVVPFAKSLPGLLGKAIKESPDMLQDAGEWMAETMIVAMKAWWDIKEWAGGVIITVYSKFQALKEEIEEIGALIVKAIFTGYYDAVKNTNWGNPIAFMVDAVKSVLDSDSPSKVFMAVGNDAAEGLWIGFKDRLKSKESEIGAAMSPFQAAIAAANAALDLLVQHAGAKVQSAADALGKARSYEQQLAAVASKAAQQWKPPSVGSAKEFVNLVANMLGANRDSIVKTATALYNEMGKNAINDFLAGSVSGLKGMAGSLSNSMLNLLAEVDRALHASPTYLTYHWGEDMVRDFAKGVHDGTLNMDNVFVPLRENEGFAKTITDALAELWAPLRRSAAFVANFRDEWLRLTEATKGWAETTDDALVQSVFDKAVRNAALLTQPFHGAAVAAGGDFDAESTRALVDIAGVVGRDLGYWNSWFESGQGGPLKFNEAGNATIPMQGGVTVVVNGALYGDPVAFGEAVQAALAGLDRSQGANI